MSAALSAFCTIAASCSGRYQPPSCSRFSAILPLSQPPVRLLKRARLITAQAEPDNDLRIPSQPPKSATLAPSLWLSREAAVEAQLKALKHNNFPYIDHGIEVMYRFTNFDPFARSNYFGVNLDLGQFERFRRIFYTKCYKTLLSHTEHTILSSLEIEEDVWMVRVHIRNDWRKDENIYEFKMIRRLGGLKDGMWFTEALKCDECEDKHLYGVM